MSKVYLSGRKWLNPENHNDSGAIQYKVDSGYGYIDCNFEIWDCSRKVALHFGFENEKQAKQRAYKVDILIKALQEMRVAMGRAYKDIDYEEDEDYE